jgi:predicted RNase H-like nuclease (RuvC/YqgF family)
MSFRSNELKDRDAKISSLTKDYEDVKKQYDALKQKFDGIKSLFA